MNQNNTLSIWKQPGMTSYDVIRLIKSKYSKIKIGHCGTLDPFAEGILVVCTGNNTKNIDKLMNYDKEYIASIYLGAETDTLDNTGDIIKKKIIKLDKKKIINVLDNFIGEIYQIPPYYSALKLYGINLYKYARKGIFIRKKPRKVIIDNIKLIDYKDNLLKIYVKCKKGTYIRSLARDIAYKLDTFGHLVDLKRTSVGPYNQENSILINDLKNVKNN